MTLDFEQITSFQNSKIKQVKKLRDKRNRERDGRFVVEYSRDLARALDYGYSVDYVLYCPQIASDDDQGLLRVIDKNKIYAVSAEIMAKASYRQNPNGLLAVLYSKPIKGVKELHQQADDLILGLVDLKKPGNIGALLRTADAAGLRTIVLIDTSLDLYNPNIIRSSTGACFLDNVYLLSQQEAVSFFSEGGYRVLASEVEAAQELYAVDFRHRSVILLGTEDQGLSVDWLDCAHLRIRIPMAGKLSDSLNVSVSGAVIMYEILRQRTLSDANF